MCCLNITSSDSVRELKTAYDVRENIFYLYHNFTRENKNKYYRCYQKNITSRTVSFNRLELKWKNMGIPTFLIYFVCKYPIWYIRVYLPCDLVLSKWKFILNINVERKLFERVYPMSNVITSEGKCYQTQETTVLQCWIEQFEHETWGPNKESTNDMKHEILSMFSRFNKLKQKWILSIFSHSKSNQIKSHILNSRIKMKLDQEKSNNNPKKGEIWRKNATASQLKQRRLDWWEFLIFK